MIPQKVGEILQKFVERLLFRLRSRKLRGEANRIRTEEYWRRRWRSERRRSGFLRFRFGIRSRIVEAKAGAGVFWRFVTSMLSASVVFGLLLFAVVTAIESAIDCYTGLVLIPTDPSFSIDVFPAIAVPVVAALLGFYLATVGIVLGNALPEVSSAVRSLVLNTPATRAYLTSIGMAIGVGLAIVLIDNTGIISLGYLVMGVYVSLVCFSGWALAKLVLGAFNLMNPIALAVEPLDRVYRAISQLDSNGVLLDDTALNASASRADQTFRTIAEIIRLTKDRESVSRNELAGMVEIILLQTNIYATKKHRLRPESGWFIREPSYPRWVESSDSARSMALETSTPLRPELSPGADWLEKRVAELVTASLLACIVTNDRDAALRITIAAGATARTLAECFRLEDATAFAEIIRDFCWNLKIKNETADAIASQPPFLMTEILLGFKNAILSWPDEIHHVVETTNWDSPKTREVQIRGSARVRQTAQHLLQQIQSERTVEGRRVTPDWYVISTLASECLLALREFADNIPRTLQHYGDMQSAETFSPEAQAMMGTQVLQMLSKATLVVETIPHVVAELEGLRQGHNPEPVSELEALSGLLGVLQSSVLVHLGGVVGQLRPDHSKTKPDYFGETLFTLIHHTERAIAVGNAGIVQRVFPSILTASLKLHGHVVLTYQPPTYEFTSWVFNPILDLLDISGLAILYEELGSGGSAEPVRKAWRNWCNSQESPTGSAKEVLDILDIISMGFTPVNITRTKWGTQLADRVVEQGYAIPIFVPYEDPPEWDAPTLIKMLGVMQSSLRSPSLDPYVIFAGEVIGPLSGETEQELRARQALRRYYDGIDRHSILDTHSESSAASHSGEEEDAS